MIYIKLLSHVILLLCQALVTAFWRSVSQLPHPLVHLCTRMRPLTLTLRADRIRTDHSLITSTASITVTSPTLLCSLSLKLVICSMETCNVSFRYIDCCILISEVISWWCLLVAVIILPFIALPNWNAVPQGWDMTPHIFRHRANVLSLCWRLWKLHLHILNFWVWLIMSIHSPLTHAEVFFCLIDKRNDSDAYPRPLILPHQCLKQ